MNSDTSYFLDNLLQSLIDQWPTHHYRPIHRCFTPIRGGMKKDNIMQKPNTVFAKKPATASPAGGKTEAASDPKHAPVAHADKHDASTNAKHAQKK